MSKTGSQECDLAGVSQAYVGAKRPVYAARYASGNQEISREFHSMILEESKDFL